MNIALGVATYCWQDWTKCVRTWNQHSLVPVPIYYVRKKSILDAFRDICEVSHEDVIGFVHDDLVCQELDWDVRVMAEFEDPTVGLVGFAGGIGHGLPQMYKEPFKIPNLIRRGFISNLHNAEIHGTRFTGERDVAVLDGLALFVRRSVLDTWGGWPKGVPMSYFMYSEGLCCEVRRQGLRIRLIGVKCDHMGGKSSGTPLPYSYEEEHRYFFEHNRDVMPYEVPR